MKEKIELKDLRLDSLDLLHRSILVTAGSYKEGNFNTMTINWGFFGELWFKPSVLMTIRPQRYTLEFLKKYDSFTLTILPDAFKSEYALMGSKSGRDTDKMKESKLTPIASEVVEAPSYAEACLTLECKKAYIGDMEGNGIVDPETIKEDYADGDFHKFVIGHIVNAWKTDEF